MSNDWNSWNSQVIKEFRENHGKVGGNFEGSPVLIIHTNGARSDRPHVNPLMYLKDGDRYLVFASKGGADTNPDWYYNLKAHPDIQIEVGDDTLNVRADEVKGAERDTLYKRQSDLYQGFAEYQRKTKRIIPVIALTKR
jgi:deazaflavin-dependent oxidoreductase (nitroreductase family)